MASGRKIVVTTRGKELRFAVMGMAAALPSLIALWGFTVDDALISARLAAHLASGVGYRFNSTGPVVDAVTPLGFAFVLAPFAGGGPLAAFFAARVMGAVAWMLAAAWMGLEIGRRGVSRARFVPLLVVALSAPLGAWAGAGMETGLVTALATLAIHRSRYAVLAAGLAAAWRPELLPWAMLLGVGTALARSSRPGPAIGGWALAVAPACVVAVARWVAFGSAMPLAVLAKPASLDEGIRYAVGAGVLSAAPLLVLAPRAWRALSRHDVALLIAALGHLPAVALAGGDWMPLYRLVVPVLPGFVVVGAAIAEHAKIWATVVRSGLALAAALMLWVGLGPSSRRVWTHRAALIASARAPLASATRVATLDAGWVGVATSAEIVDAAGVTDPRVARLAGSHTSKQLPERFLDERHADCALTLWDEGKGDWFRLGDARLARQAAAAGWFRAAELPLSGSPYRYFLWKRP